MKFLIESFYRSIWESAPDPIPHSQILLTARIMGEIFAQLDAQATSGSLRAHVEEVPLSC
jgi:hypothetical protein